MYQFDNDGREWKRIGINDQRELWQCLDAHYWAVCIVGDEVEHATANWTTSASIARAWLNRDNG